MLKDKTVTEYLEKTASGEPVPGGGSIAALSAAAAASLTAACSEMTTSILPGFGGEVPCRTIRVRLVGSSCVTRITAAGCFFQVSCSRREPVYIYKWREKNRDFDKLSAFFLAI